MSEENQPSTEAASPPPEAMQFDFWLGRWDLTWGEDGQGTNQIDKILGDRIIREQFAAEPSGSFSGLSVSTYDAAAGCWKQTWVDSSGLYLDFTGGWLKDRMIPRREAILAGKPIKQRMVWYNIQMDTLEWLWQRSEDGGESWSTLWHIHYQRRPS